MYLTILSKIYNRNENYINHVTGYQVSIPFTKIFHHLCSTALSAGVLAVLWQCCSEVISAKIWHFLSVKKILLSHHTNDVEGNFFLFVAVFSGCETETRDKKNIHIVYEISKVSFL